MAFQCIEPANPRPSPWKKGEGVALRSGFTLLELSIVLTIIALVTGMAISSGISVVATARQAATVQKMKAIDQALMAYRVANSRLPCPGDLTIKQGSANFGVEAGGSSVCTTGTGVCTASTTAGTCIGTAVSPAANYSAKGTTYTLETGAEGAVPVVTLGLPNDMMVDGWGNRFRYAADTTMTTIGAFHDSPVNNTSGAITVNDVNGNARATDAIYALISHGANGHGTYTQAGVTVNAGSANANELTNCHCTSAGVYTGTYAPTYVQEQSPTLDPTNSLDTYDDLVTYKERWQMQTSWDPIATIYIADSDGGCVHKIQGCTITTVAGHTATPWGYGGTMGCDSTMGYSGDGGAAIGAELYWPDGLAVDNSGNIYISDQENYRIRKVTASTGIITTVAGNGTAGYSGDGGAAISAKLSTTAGVAVDSSGNIYIVEYQNSRIRKVTASTGIITTVAGNGGFGYSGDGGPATSAKLDWPTALALDSSGNIYLGDNGSGCIRKVTASTGIITTVAGHTTGGLCDGTNGFSGDGGPATSATLSTIDGVAVDSVGNIYISDWGWNRIRKVTAATGIITTVAGNGTGGYSGDGGPATSAQLDNPGGIAVDSAGNLYIADSWKSYIRKVAASTGTITTLAGQGFNVEWAQEGGPATNSYLGSPFGIAVVPGVAVSNR